mmetsp:Transcript_19248/g.66379  ORF Transcript_19248/g.66379 Transcript_19248/m.66379 type:complete len:221 (-) Transcript_19248:3168-3830(-)
MKPSTFKGARRDAAVTSWASAQYAVVASAPAEPRADANNASTAPSRPSADRRLAWHAKFPTSKQAALLAAGSSAARSKTTPAICGGLGRAAASVVWPTRAYSANCTARASSRSSPVATASTNALQPASPSAATALARALAALHWISADWSLSRRFTFSGATMHRSKTGNPPAATSRAALGEWSESRLASAEHAASETSLSGARRSTSTRASTPPSCPKNR